MFSFQSPRGEEKHHAYRSPLEEKLQNVITPFQQFVKGQVFACGLLMLAIACAIVFASVPSLQVFHTELIQLPIGIKFGNLVFARSLHYWINDILLTLFFFLVGLEIKRELLVGELRDPRQASLAFVAAFGGMLVPAIIYTAFNFNTEYAGGWEITMATDTAFALGILSYFRRKVPVAIFAFVAALAIIDDIGAILAIAIFYNQSIDIVYLGASALVFCILILLNYAGVRKAFPYIIVGFIFWLLISHSGVHATFSGVAIALAIPARPRNGPRELINESEELLHEFSEYKEENPLILADDKQHDVLEKLEVNVKQATTPLQRWSERVDLPISLIILPLFAFANAAIPVNMASISSLFSNNVNLGIIFGLFFGKPIGIIVFCFIALRLGIAHLPSQMRFSDIAKISVLMGIGFTVSIFFANTYFAEQTEMLVRAKSAILFVSILSGIVGAGCLMLSKKYSPPIKN